MEKLRRCLICEAFKRNKKTMKCSEFKKTWVVQCLMLMLIASTSTLVLAEEQTIDKQVSKPVASSKPSGILPLPDYSGDFSKRAYLMGDLGGKRSEWAERGVTFNVDSYHYVQSITDGGVETDTEGGAVIDMNVAVDFDRMGVIPGGLLQVQLVSRYGDSVNGISGSAIPVNANATTPTTATADDDVALYIPVFNYTQFLSQKFALLVGKINTYPQSNEFNGGSGKSQFWNLNVAAPASPALIAPYSALAVGAIILPSPNLAIELVAGTSKDTSNHSGFDYLDDGKFALFKVVYQYQFQNLPGGLNNQLGYGFDSDFTELNSRLSLGPTGLTATTKGSTWFNSLDVWQYLWVEDGASRSVNLNDGRQDLQGIGFFSRYQVADKDTNPLDYLITVGLAAKGLFPNRDNDTMGIAFNKNKLQRTRLGNFAGLDDESTTWEAYYNFEITPAVYLSLDAQLVDGPFSNVDTATILGAQLQIRM